MRHRKAGRRLSRTTEHRQARRQALAVIRTKKAHLKLFHELRERYQDRPGGYTRIIPLGVRRGDGAPLSLLELVGRPEKLPKKKKKKSAA